MLCSRIQIADTKKILAVETEAILLFVACSVAEFKLLIHREESGSEESFLSAVEGPLTKK